MLRKISAQQLAYWEKSSYMLVVPEREDEGLLKMALDRLAQSNEIHILNTNYELDGVVSVSFIYEDENYEVGLYQGPISVPEYYLHKNFLFTEEERCALLKARQCITLFMHFESNPKKSFHLQLKLACLIVPDLIGVMDESAEVLFPPKWVEMTAVSKVLPSSKDLFSVQAVQGKNGKVWLHTHGLCRCGLTELEILEASKEQYSQYFNILTVYAMFLLDKKEMKDPYYKGECIGRLINGYPVVVTCIPWVEGIRKYKQLKLGNLNDRKCGHNTKTSIVFLYASEEDEKNCVVSNVSLYDDFWEDAPLFLFSDEETQRMSDLARERFSYVKEAFKKGGNHILIKIGLPLKEAEKYEHIWFELLEIKGG